MNYTSVPPDCGVTTHGDDCLCDVTIGEPTPINHPLNDIWHMDVIMRIKNLSAPFSSADLADMLEALGEAYDATRQVAGLAAEQIENIEEQRNEIAGLLQSGESIVDLPEILDVPFGRILQLLSRNRVTPWWAWDELKWIEVEGMIRDPDGGPSSYEAERILGIDDNTIIKLWKLYGRTEFGQSAKAKRDEKINQIIIDFHELPLAKLADVVAQQGITDISPQQLSNRRSRMKKEGKLVRSPSYPQQAAS